MPFITLTFTLLSMMQLFQASLLAVHVVCGDFGA